MQHGRLFAAGVLIFSLGIPLGAQAPRKGAPAPAGQAAGAAANTKVLASIDSRFQEYDGLQKQIWGFAEVGYVEEKSSALLQSQLKAAGFTVQAGVADEPTAFVASYGSGKPVIGILAEYDALPGLSQQAIPEKKAVVEGAPGHGCGHHLFGVASVATGIAVKEWLVANGKTGTIRVYGTPAEEGGAGKAYQVRAGLFNDVDAVINWHPGDRNEVDADSSLAVMSAKFRFHGVSSHAAGAPERGRSALDAVEAMDHMVDMLREHVPQETRIHYVITRGGLAPNVVPDFAEVWTYARQPSIEVLNGIWNRIVKAAEGAALGTDTKMDYEMIHAAYNLLPNEYLADLQRKNLNIVGGVKYSAEEQAFAEKILKTYDGIRMRRSARRKRCFPPGGRRLSAPDRPTSAM